MSHNRNGKDSRVMKITGKMKITGLDLDFASIENTLQEELESLAKDIESKSKQVCPVDTGFLRDSIEAEIGHLQVNVGTDCDYAEVVHDGDHDTPARPFLLSTANIELEGIESKLAKAIEKIL
jgi:hypothetical protein